MNEIAKESFSRCQREVTPPFLLQTPEGQTADVYNIEEIVLQKRQFFGSWFTSFSCILTTPCVGYHACKSIESVVYCLNNILQISPHPFWPFSLTWPVSMQIYWNKRKCLHKKRVQLPRDWFETPTWPPFHCFGKPIWPPWRHVKTLYYDVIKLHLLWSSTKNQ